MTGVQTCALPIFPIPLVGPEWLIARRISHLVGAPIPDHVAQLMQRGLLADGAKAARLLGFTPRLTTPEVIDHLHSWESVVRIGRVA